MNLSAWCEGSAAAYLAGRDPRDPLASPLPADLAGLPPLLVQVASGELLLDEVHYLMEERGYPAFLTAGLIFWFLGGGAGAGCKIPCGRRRSDAESIFQPQVSAAGISEGEQLEGGDIWFVGAAYRAAAFKLWKAVMNSR